MMYLCPPIRVLTTLGWNNLPAYLSCPGTWLPLKGRQSGSCSSLYLYLQHVAAPSLHMHWWDQVKSRKETLRASQKSLYHLQTSWRGSRDKKKSPLSLSNLNSCHINNLRHWDVQIPDNQFPTVQHKAPRRKTQCAFIQIYVATKPSYKTNIPWNTPRETLL